ncbi:MAG TPA: sulfurtransferase TusA family protein [Nitrososphaeraceae archaeon]|nr:sulfurtransferase TusA family protein [Nitrososphaeraceae archaeon]
MIIDNCNFPDNLLYDLENFVWLDISNANSIKLGIIPILSFISGKITTIKLKHINSSIEKGKSIGSIESLKYFGIVRSPIGGKITEINTALQSKPKQVNDSPYDFGWLVKINPSNLETDLKTLRSITESLTRLKNLIDEFHVRCFKAYPDYEMYELGTECAATLSKLDDLIDKIKIGEIVYLASDDITADLELMRWAHERSHSILEIRKEGAIFHFLVKKEKNN